MSTFQTAYLVMVVAGFAAFGVALFSGWVFTNWSEWRAPKGHAAREAPVEAPVANDYHRAA